MLRSTLRSLPVSLALTLAACGGSGTSGGALDPPQGDSSAERSPGRPLPPIAVTGGYKVVPLVSDTAGAAPNVDARLVNAWGLVASGTSPWWVSDNGTGLSTLYDGAGVAQAVVATIPGIGSASGTPTGVVFNATASFLLHNGTSTLPARFLFASEDGTLSGWSAGTGALRTVDNSSARAVYKGLAIASTTAGDRLFATDFHNARVDVFDGKFQPVAGPAFVDPRMAKGFAPFGIQTIGAVVYVTYAQQDADQHDEVDGRGLGFVSAFDTAGKFLGRVASRGRLNAPWGVALAPADFGVQSGKLIVGNFGDGRLNAYPPLPVASVPRGEGDDEREDREQWGEGEPLRGPGGPITIDGLWGIAFGNGGRAGPANRLYFAAGPGGEQHGLFGYLAVNGVGCAALTGLSLPDGSSVTSGTLVPAGPFTPPGAPTATTVPPFCRVAGVSKPTSDSLINFEVWLPLSGWNGKLDHAGNGGYGGSLATPAGIMLDGLLRGYATTGSDMGHDASVTPGASFALGHPEKIRDWAYRANHVTAIAAKQILRAFYDQPAHLSYFTGCSDGGHEGLMEAQRFPNDFDGIVAGAPANHWTHQSASWVWDARAALDDPASTIPLSKLPMLNAAAVAACPGVIPTVIDDPVKCAFDPGSLLCAGADQADCLTAAQVEAVRKVYAGPVNPRTGARIYPGLERGSEAAEGSLGAGGSWSALIGGPQTFLGGDFYKYMVFNDANWDFHTLDFAKDIAKADAAMHAIIDSTDPDLEPFRRHGGRLLLYQGWADPLVNPRNVIEYLASVHVRDHRAGDFVRLFMAPGMTHCAGGPGLNTFDTLTALEQWREHGAAPASLAASHTALAFPDNVMSRNPPAGTFARPLCPYPQAARWDGMGDKALAASFTCQ